MTDNINGCEYHKCTDYNKNTKTCEYAGDNCKYRSEDDRISELEAACQRLREIAGELWTAWMNGEDDFNDYDKAYAKQIEQRLKEEGVLK